MLFDPRAALAEILRDGQDPAIRAIPAIPCGRIAEIAEIATGQSDVAKAERPAAPDPSPPARQAYPHGRCSLTGNPRTWTGRSVTPEQWRKLSDWDRHGSTGKLFCGICRAWVTPGSFPACHAGVGASKVRADWRRDRRPHTQETQTQDFGRGGP